MTQPTTWQWCNTHNKPHIGNHETQQWCWAGYTWEETNECTKNVTTIHLNFTKTGHQPDKDR